MTAFRVVLNHYKQARVFSNNCQQSGINVATMMLDTAKNKRDDAMEYLKGNRRKEEILYWKTAETVGQSRVVNDKHCPK